MNHGRNFLLLKQRCLVPEGAYLRTVIFKTSEANTSTAYTQKVALKVTQNADPVAMLTGGFCTMSPDIYLKGVPEE